MKSMYSGVPFGTDHALEVQARQLADWKTKLTKECFAALLTECNAQNERHMSSQIADFSNNGYDVFRGGSLTNFVQNWKPASK